VMGVLTVVRACFDVLEVVGVYALFLGSGTFDNRDLGWTPYTKYITHLLPPTLQLPPGRPQTIPNTLVPPPVN
jgi:hypothetical protein